MSVVAPRWEVGVYERTALGSRQWIGGHIRALDGLRGVAVLAVMIHHFSRAVPNLNGLSGVMQRAALVGWRGVDLFFVLSGFLITGILLDAKGSDSYFKTFYIRRALRIFPLYYGVVLLAFIGMHIPAMRSFFALGRIQSSLGWLCFYGNNIAMAGHRDMEIFGTLGHFWSLAVEEHFYLVWPAIVFFCTRRQLVKVAIACFFLAFALRMTLAVWTRSWVPGYVLTPCRIDGLALGALLAVVVRSNLSVTNVRRAARWAVIVGMIALGTAGIGGHHYAGRAPFRRVFEAIEPTGYALVFVGLMAIVLSSRPREMMRWFFELRPLRSMGRYSYAIYVLHLIFLPAFIRWFGPTQLEDLVHSRNVAALDFCALAILASYSIAFVSWNVYEKHFLKLKDLFRYEPAAMQPSASDGIIQQSMSLDSLPTASALRRASASAISVRS